MMNDSIRKVFKGNPYRNYLNVENGKLHKTKSDKLYFLPTENHFRLLIPDDFIELGLDIKESSTFNEEGSLIIKDLSGKILKCEWKAHNIQKELNKQSKWTPGKLIY